jgi:HSP20 family molecular chaperone IbpA
MSSSSSHHNHNHGSNKDWNSNTNNALIGKSLDRIVEHHRRVLAQSMAMVKRPQQQQPNTNLHHYYRRHHQSLVSALAAWQSQLEQEQQHLLEGFPFPFGPTTAPTTNTANTAGTAPAELAENQECIRLTIDLPGVYQKDVKVHVQEHGNVLTVHAVRRTFSVSDRQVCIKKQRIARSFAIDTTVVNLAQVSVTLENGVLTIQAPKWTTTLLCSSTVETSHPKQQRPPQDEAEARSTDNTTSAHARVNDNEDDIKANVSLDSLDIDQSPLSLSSRNTAATKNGSSSAYTIIAPSDDD